MEIIVHTIKDLNRFLNLGLYILVDSDKICLISLSIGLVLKEFPSSDTLTFYQYLLELKRLIVSWDMHRTNNRVNTTNVVRGQIYTSYRFDIDKHYKLNKYGNC